MEDCTVVPPADLVDYTIHRPPIQVVIGQDLQRETVFDLILLHSLLMSVLVNPKIRKVALLANHLYIQ